MKRLLVTGSRNLTGERAENGMYHTLNAIMALLGADSHDIVLIHGGARGADTLADRAGRQLGMHIEPHPADWQAYGRAAGPIRNRQMVDLGADLCLGFPLGTSKGTWNCMRTAAKAGIPTLHCVDFSHLTVDGIPDPGATLAKDLLRRTLGSADGFQPVSSSLTVPVSPR